MTDLPAVRASADRSPPLDVRLADEIARDIIAGRIAPGAWLREQDLAARFQVSRSPIREALRHVAQRGFLTLHPWRGVQVRDLTAKETRYVYDLLEGVLGVVAKAAAENFPLDRIATLWVTVRQAEVLLVHDSTREERSAISFRMFRQLGRGGGSEAAFEMMMQLGGMALWQHRYMPPHDLDTARRQFELHRVLVDAVAHRDVETAEAAARRIAAITRSDLLAHMQAPPTD